MNYTTVRYMMTPRQMVLLDMPIDDPYGGPAYGHKEKSSGLGMVIGIVASVVTMGVGAAAWAAAQTIGGFLSAGAMMAGGAMSLIGTVTGNKKLSMIGGVLSLAGGIGASFSAPSTAGAEGGATSLMDEATKSVSNSFSSAWKSVVGDGAKTGVDAANAAVGETIGTGADTAIAGSGQPGIDLPSTTSSMAATPSAPAAGDLANTAPNLSLDQASGANAALTQQPSAASLSDVLPPSATPGAGVTPPPADKGIIGGIMDYAKTPAGGQVIGGLVSGAANGYGQSEQAAAQQDFLDWKKELDNRAYTNAQGVVAMIDPNAPDAQQRIEYAKSKGIPISTVSVNPNAAVQTPNLNKPQGA